MEKAKVKKKNHYVSIVIIPHDSSKTKSFDISHFYLKACACILAVIMCLTIISIRNTDLSKENNALILHVDQLDQLNKHKDIMLSEDDKYINSLKSNQIAMYGQVRQITEEYNKIAGIFLKTSSRGTSKGQNYPNAEIAQNMQNIKSLIDHFDETNDLNKDPDLEQTAHNLNVYLEHIPTFVPVKGRITSRFGIRNDPFNSTKKFHAGLDVAAPRGTPIKSAASGTVIMADRNSGYGNMIMIDHGNGLSTVYGHASKLLVKEGDKIKKGDIIAEVGSTGRSTGPHLHFEVRLNGEPIDPVNYINESKFKDEEEK
ncbi:MAG: M23 family metallopeptidase [Xylanivirga thermophila]|jgi:murein DD-endopeptidase MepM/ murein hydrolase activator NlpD|uniref:M23 family metallopeptidase n=1 Tax=Xylanivirga thermophila TaxID=2496273 RepID=UPI0039F495FC